MNNTHVKDDWTEQKAKLKKKFSVLTDADVHCEAGKKEEMMTKIQVKLGKTKQELHAIIAAL